SMVERVRRVVIEGGLAAPVLVGHSASAALVAIYAARFPTAGIVEVEGAFDIGPFAALMQSFDPEVFRTDFDTVWGMVSGAAVRLGEVSPDVRAFVAATSRPRADVVLGNWSDLRERPVAELRAWIDSVAADIRRTGTPIVSVVGSEPSATEAEWLRANLPEARTLVWPGSGHFPPLAYPTRFAELLASTGASVRP